MGAGQSRCVGLKTTAEVVAENVTVPVGATPELPTAGFVEVNVSTSTVNENAVFAATDVTLGVTAAAVGALVTVTLIAGGGVVLLKLLSP